jgi:hypothetical protein
VGGMTCLEVSKENTDLWIKTVVDCIICSAAISLFFGDSASALFWSD